MKLPSRLLRFIAAVFLSCLALNGWAAEYGVNLVTNGDAESVPKTTSGVTTLSGWTSSGPVTILAYGSGGYPSLTDPGPTTRGNNFFYGGAAATSTAYQRVDLSFAAADIDAGKVLYDLSAWIGGYSSQRDSAAVVMGFLDASGNALGSGTPTVGPVSPSDRGSLTQLLARAKIGVVPTGARFALVTMNFIRDAGTACDGYLDGISLVLSLAPSSADVAIPSVACPEVLNADNSISVAKFDAFADALTARLQLSSASDGGLVASVGNLGQTAKNNCDPVDTGVVVGDAKGYTLHLPSVMLGASRYWTNFDVLVGADGSRQLRLAKYGQGINGVSGAGSAYQSLAKVDQFSSTGNAFSYRKIFPDNSEHQVSVSLLPDQIYTPSAAETTVISQLASRAYGMKTAYSNTGDSYQLSAQFFVPYSSLTNETAQQIRNGGKANAVAAKRTNTPRNRLSGGQSGVTVAINSVGKSVGKEAAGQLVEKGLGKVAGKSLGVGMDAYDAWNAIKDHMAWNSRLDAAERCYKINVTDPAVKQQIGSDISQTRSEINGNAITNYLSMLASTALSFVEAPLFVATGAMTDTVGDAVTEVNEQRVQQIESAAGKCDIRWAVTFKGSGSVRVEGTEGLGYSSIYRKSQTDFTWKISRNKEVFKDNTRGTQSSSYGKNHVDDYQDTQRSITGSHHSVETGPGYSEECQGSVYDAAWEAGDEITDNLAYPPGAEFHAKIAGFTDVMWRGTCTNNGSTSNAQGTVKLDVPAHATFDMPADFRSKPVNQEVAGTFNSTSLDGRLTRSTNWSGDVEFLPY